jgi:sulfate permease, SulP family
MTQGRMPKLVESLQDYNLQKFVSDLIAGLTVGIVALPLAMAFAISSGVTPQAGLYCAVVAGFLISALGGSKTQIGGPTGAFVVIVFGIVAQHGLNGLFLCTIMAGIMLVILGVTGLGTAVKFIPRPVVVGFTNGIAVLIASTQIKDFFGLQIESVPGEFWGRMEVIAARFHTLSPASTLLALASLAVIILCMRFLKRVPGSIVALLLGTAIVVVFQLPVDTIGTRFGGIPSGWPSFDVPQFRPDMIVPLLSPALTIAMLGAIESLMSAVVADRMSGDKHNPNVELVAQGVANIAAPFFGGLPATGAIARTATNIRSGAKTPVAGIIHAFTLLAVLLFAAPLAQYIPLAVLSAILMVVAYNMGEWKEIPRLLKMSWATVSVWLITFALTVFADLTVAVQFGIVLAALLFIRDVANTTTVSRVTKEYLDDGRLHILQDKYIPDYVTVIRIHGPFLFGTTDKLAEVTDRIDELTPVVIVRLRNMTAIDATGLLALEDLADRLHATGRILIVCGARPQPARLMRQAEFERHLGNGNICTDIDAALERAVLFYSSHTVPGWSTAQPSGPPLPEGGAFASPRALNDRDRKLPDEVAT